MNPEFKKALLEAIRPFEQRIAALEELNQEKEREILTLKLAVAHLHNTVLTLNGKVPTSEKKPKLEERKDDRREERKEASKRVISPRPQSASKKKASSGPEDTAIELQFGKKVLSVYPPSRISITSDPPQYELSLSRVQGYNGRGGRHNLWFMDDSYIVYPAGCICVVYNVDTHLQTFFSEHVHEVTAVAVSKERRLVASGETKEALVYVWQVDDKSVKYRLQFHERSVVALGFNPAGSFLVSIGGDAVHTLAVWSLAGSIGRPTATAQTDKAVLLGVQCSEFQETLTFATFGDRHLKLWELKSDELVSARVSFGASDTPKTVLCVTFIQSSGVIVGTDNGHMYLIIDNVVKQRFKAHDGAVCALRSFLDENNDQYLVSVGLDANISLWNDEIQLVSSLSYMSQEVVSVLSAGIPQKPKAMDVQNTGVILIGTGSGAIIKTSLGGGGSPLVAGHSGDVGGVSVHPSLEEIVTVGEDKTLRVWDGAMIRIQQVLPMQQKLTKCEFSTDGRELAIGCTEGNVKIMEWPSLAQVQELKALASFPISVLRYSPDGEYLMAGCKDRAFIWKATEDYKVVTVLQGCSGTVNHASFSSNGQYLMCNSSDSEIVVWEVTGKRILKLSAVRDENWYDWSLIYGWQISGAWNKGEIESACANPCSSMLAVGDTIGNLRLHQYPCIGTKGISKDAHAHTSPIQEIKWAGDTTLISVGGPDQTLALWTCVL